MKTTTVNYRSETRLAELRGQFIARSLMFATFASVTVAGGGVLVLAVTSDADPPILFGVYVGLVAFAFPAIWLTMLNRYDARYTPPPPKQPRREIPVYTFHSTGGSGVGEAERR